MFILQKNFEFLIYKWQLHSDNFERLKDITFAEIYEIFAQKPFPKSGNAPNHDRERSIDSSLKEAIYLLLCIVVSSKRIRVMGFLIERAIRK